MERWAPEMMRVGIWILDVLQGYFQRLPVSSAETAPGVDGDGGLVGSDDVGSACVDDWRLGFHVYEYGVSAAQCMKGDLRVREEEIKDWDNEPTGVVEFSILPLTEYPSIVMLYQPCSTTGTDTKSPVCLVESRPPSISELFSEAFARPR